MQGIWTASAKYSWTLNSEKKGSQRSFRAFFRKALTLPREISSGWHWVLIPRSQFSTFLRRGWNTLYGTLEATMHQQCMYMVRELRRIDLDDETGALVLHMLIINSHHQPGRCHIRNSPYQAWRLWRTWKDYGESIQKRSFAVSQRCGEYDRM